MIGRSRRRHCRRRAAADRRDAAARRPADLAGLYRRRRRRCDRRRDRGRRRQGADARVRHPGVGRIAMVADPQGSSLLCDEADPAGRRAEATERRLLGRPSRAARRLERAVDHRSGRGASTSTATSSAGPATTYMPMGEMGEYRFFAARRRRRSARSCASHAGRPRPGWRYYIGVAVIDRAAEAVEGRRRHGRQWAA